MVILPTEIEIEPQPFAVVHPQLPANRRRAQIFNHVSGPDSGEIPWKILYTPAQIG